MTDLQTLSREQYERLPYASHSGLKTFISCPRLYYERYVTREHVDAEQDYFIYGHLVDCLVTTPSLLNERFARVTRKSNGGTLDLEMDIQSLEQEIEQLKPLVAEGKKRAIASLAKKEKDLVGLRQQIEECQSISGRVQVTNALWQNAFETAAVINANPFLVHLRRSYTCTPQVTLVDEQLKRKGIIDLLFVNEQGEYVIVDIKTTYRLRDLNPEDYAAQFAIYRELVRHNFKTDSIRCVAIVGDKDPDHKMAQDFEYSAATLDIHLRTIEEVESSWATCVDKEFWPSAKELRGREQECFRCSMCSVRPFSQDAQPVLI